MCCVFVRSQQWRDGSSNCMLSTLEVQKNRRGVSELGEVVGNGDLVANVSAIWVDLEEELAWLMSVLPEPLP